MAAICSAGFIDVLAVSYILSSFGIFIIACCLYEGRE